MVVEGNAAVQELVEYALREPGHHVLVTRNPREALELGRRVRFDVLVASVDTLEREGPSLVRELRRIQPSLPVVYLANGSGADDTDSANASALQRPFTLAELQEVVGASLDGGAETNCY